MSRKEIIKLAIRTVQKRWDFDELKYGDDGILGKIQGGFEMKYLYLICLIALCGCMSKQEKFERNAWPTTKYYKSGANLSEAEGETEMWLKGCKTLRQVEAMKAGDDNFDDDQPRDFIEKMNKQGGK